MRCNVRSQSGLWALSRCRAVPNTTVSARRLQSGSACKDYPLAFLLVPRRALWRCCAYTSLRSHSQRRYHSSAALASADIPQPPASATASSSSSHCDAPPQTLLSSLQSALRSGSRVVPLSINIRGWVRSVRISKQVAFAVVNDGTTMQSLQCVLPPADARSLTNGASVSITGTLVFINPSSTLLPPQQLNISHVELHTTSLTLVGPSPASYPIGKHNLTLEYLRDVTHLRFRTNTLSALVRIRATAFHAFHRYLTEQSFLHVHTPLITPLDCEGGGEAFSVSAPSDKPNSLFFARPAYLTVSSQLYAELLSSSLTRVYAFAPTFRAETSSTPRHLAEFWMLEPELSWCTLHQLMDTAEAMLKAVIQHTMDERQEELHFLQQRGGEGAKGLVGRLQGVLGGVWMRMTYTEAVDVLLRSGVEFEFPVVWGDSLHSEHEKWLAEIHCKGSDIDPHMGQLMEKAISAGRLMWLLYLVMYCAVPSSSPTTRVASSRST